MGAKPAPQACRERSDVFRTRFAPPPLITAGHGIVRKGAMVASRWFSPQRTGRQQMRRGNSVKGMKFVIVSLCGVVISTLAFAETMSVVPELQEGERVIRKDLPKPTLVEHYHYSLLVPQGWSFEASVLTEGPYQGNLSAFPSNDIVNEKTHVGVF